MPSFLLIFNNKKKKPNSQPVYRFLSLYPQMLFSKISKTDLNSIFKVYTVSITQCTDYVVLCISRYKEAFNGILIATSIIMCPIKMVTAYFVQNSLILVIGNIFFYHIYQYIYALHCFFDIC